MTPDPLDPLLSYYNDCHLALVPDSLTVVPAMLPWWCRLLVPAGGLGLGGILALVLLLSGSNPTKQEALEATRNFARAKYDFAMNQKPIAPPKEHLHSERKALGGRPWIG